MATDLYQSITDRILSLLEQGIVPWRSPILGHGPAGRPRNFITGRDYRGINVFLLAMTRHMEGYASSRWLTFRQANEIGGSVRKGERSTLVVFWKSYQTTDRVSGEEKTVPVLRYFRLFNADQCEGLPAEEVATPIEAVRSPIESAAAIVGGYRNPPTLEHAGVRAFYRPSDDLVRVPPIERFVGMEEYYATLLHEMAHSTAHSKRLARGIDTNPQSFGSSGYAKEELVAEMGAAFLCAEAGISPSVIENQAAYIGGWMQRLRDDKRLVVTAAAAGQKAADWILGRAHPNETPSEEAVSS
ncbi:MAG TPA: zincin-like metallopeptidase domain-containing protein [Phycisphaerales bacterium]|nr:zincin-like metallopeptidase domain-containing protein [Phycisphaerales bacterium]